MIWSVGPCGLDMRDQSLDRLLSEGICQEAG
jgi:hypothetical protein